MQSSKHGRADVTEFVRQVIPGSGDALLIVPPFADVRVPPIAAHLLQAQARAAGFRVAVLYGSLSFANWIGHALYGTIAGYDREHLIGEGVFSAAAYGLPLLGRDRERREARPKLGADPSQLARNRAGYERAAAQAAVWTDALAGAVVDLDYAVIGCTSMFDQNTASIAILDRIKRLKPETTTIIGGANCTKEMSEGVAALSTRIDFVFSGESDAAFTEFLRQHASGRRPAERIVPGTPCRDLDALATPSYDDYLLQLEYLHPFSPDTAELWKFQLPLESSRGCWWAQKHRCTFCGFNDVAAGYREKSSDRVIEELEQLVAEYPLDSSDHGMLRVAMTDNIMPHSYFRTLLPRLKERRLDVGIFYEIKANLTLARMRALKDAGVVSIQPGVESLSTPYLKRMNKGVTAPWNIAVLRYAASTEVNVSYNILTDFPNDRREELEQMVRILPLMRHLAPPIGVSPLAVSRFSPYHEQPGEHGMVNLRPADSYSWFFPADAPVETIACDFEADFDCASRRHPEIVARLHQEVADWRAAWTGPARKPLLGVHWTSALYGRTTGTNLVLIDTRGLPGTTSHLPLTEDQAMLALVRRRLDDSPEIDWALERKLGVVMDGLFVPLAVTDPETLSYFEARAGAA